MQTPKQIAEDFKGAFEVRDGDVQETSWSYIKGIIAEAVEADRKQRANEDALTRAYDSLMAAGKRALADELVASQTQRAADLEILADAAASWAEHLEESIESYREDDEDRVTDGEEVDNIQTALGRYLDEKEQG